MMNLFLRFEIEKIYKYFKTKTIAKIITSALFIAVFAFVGTGIYAFFVTGFRFINIEAVEDIRLALTLFLNEVFLLILGGIIVFSTLVSGIFNLFRSENTSWLLSSPNYTMLPKVVAVRSFFHALLPSLIFFIPAILAFNKVNHTGMMSLVFILLSVILLLILLSTLTLISILAIGSLYYAITKILPRIGFTFRGFMIIIFSGIALLLAGLWKVVRSIDLVQLFKADIASENVNDVLNISNISSHFSFLPTHPFAMELVYWQNGKTNEALFSFGILFVLTLLSVSLWWYLSRAFYSLWQKFQEGSTDRSNSGDSNMHMTYHFKGSETSALFKKEALVFSRNFKGILWFTFLSSIWLLYIGGSLVLGHTIRRYQPDISERLIYLQILQFIVAIYFISAFALRFVFPAFSVEKKTSWILGTAPLSFRKIFFGKYIFYTSFFVIFGMIMSYINSMVLGLTFNYAIASLILFVTSVVFIITFALSLGALFPSRDTDDPEVISTSMPGLFFTALALLYGAFGDWVLYLTLKKDDLIWLLLFVTCSLCVAIALLIITPRISKKLFSRE